MKNKMIVFDLLTEEDLEIIRDEKEFKREMNKLKKFLNCSCGYKGQGKGLKFQQEDMINHIKENHPERRKFEL